VALSSPVDIPATEKTRIFNNLMAVLKVRKSIFSYSRIMKNSAQQFLIVYHPLLSTANKRKKN